MIFRKATIKDLRSIISLLIEDELGKTREVIGEKIDEFYIRAFGLIEKDPNQYLMVVEREEEIIGTCHLTIMPSLTFKGTTRMQIEGVRIAARMRGEHLGEVMMKHAIEYAKAHGIGMIQLMTNKERSRATHFYEKVGFKATHEGMKLVLN